MKTTCIGYCMELWKLNPSGKVWEKAFVIGKENEFPEEIDPTPNPRSPDNYAVWYGE